MVVLSQLNDKQMLLLWIFSPYYVMLRQSEINIQEVHIIKLVHSQVIINCNPCGPDAPLPLQLGF